MGVYINMEMPQSCDDCRLNNGISCYAVPEYTEDGVVGRTEDRPDWCPLVPVLPHGRTIDADELFNDICNSLNEMTAIGIAVDGEWMWGKLNDALRNAPTIIPAEEKK